YVSIVCSNELEIIIRNIVYMPNIQHFTARDDPSFKYCSIKYPIAVAFGMISFGGKVVRTQHERKNKRE
ncbi:hypothetical protein L9F63_007887, partial [Diploptera punctata]